MLSRDTIATYTGKESPKQMAFLSSPPVLDTTFLSVPLLKSSPCNFKVVWGFGSCVPFWLLLRLILSNFLERPHDRLSL